MQAKGGAEPARRLVYRRRKLPHKLNPQPKSRLKNAAARGILKGERRRVGQKETSKTTGKAQIPCGGAERRPEIRRKSGRGIENGKKGERKERTE